jgi:hypothetical protein
MAASRVLHRARLSAASAVLSVVLYVILSVLGACTGSIEGGADTPARGEMGSSGAMTGPWSGSAPTRSEPAPTETPGPGAGGTAGAFEPAPGGARRLTAEQYANAIRDLLGGTAAVPGALDDDDTGLEFSSQGAYRVTTSPSGVEKYRDTAFQIARTIFASPASAQALLGCQPAAPGDACVEGFLARFGRRAFRRPLSAEELADYRRLVATAAAEQGNVLGALEFALAAMLQDPAFLYLVEIGEPDPTDRSRLRFTSYEMATRLALALGNTIPDQDLLDAAEKGALVTPEGLRAEAERLLGSPASRRGLSRFFAEHFHFDGLEQATKDKTIYPSFDAALALAMQGELDRVLTDLAVAGDRDFRDVFVTRETYVNKALAAHYKVPSAGTDTTFAKVELPAGGPRAGLVTMAGVLTTTSIDSRSSPTLRGVFIRERLLCQTVPQPPDDVPEIDAPERMINAKTMRERLVRHQQDPQCASCHAFIDNVGLALEQFDGIGAFRTTENGVTLDVRAELDGKAFNGGRELGALLREDPRAMACLSAALYRYFTGHHDPGAGEAPVIAKLEQSFVTSGHRFRSLLLELVTSAGFRTLSKPL